MIRGAIWLLVWLAIGIAAALVFHNDNGYVLIRFGPYILETSLVFLVFGLVAALIVLYAIWRILLAGWRLPHRMRGGRRRRRRDRAQRTLLRGLLHFWEGRWRKAETELVRRAGDSSAPVVHYLPAARAAQRQGALDRRDRYLKLAYQSEPGSELATLLTQAELQISQGQHAQAVATLSRVRELAPGEPHALRLLVDLYRALHDWEQLGELLPEIEKQKIYPREEWEALALEVYAHLLTAAAEGNRDRLTGLWETIPRDLRQRPALLRQYCAALARDGAEQEAAELITVFLRKRWDPELALAFSRLHADDPVSQLATAEEWIKRYGEKPELMLMAGRLCLRNRLWGRARNYLEASNRAQPRAEAYFELGRLLQQTNEPNAARDAFRQGLELALGTTPVEPKTPVEPQQQAVAG